MELLALPSEILRLILRQLIRKGDLKAFCEVSKAAYQHTVPVLCESVVLKQKEGDLYLPNHTITTFLARPEPSHLLRHIRELCITSDFKQYLSGSRCCSCPDDDADVEWSGSDNEFKLVSDSHPVPNILNLLESLNEGQLQSFSWDLGTCVPHDIFSSRGPLTHFQKNIKSISLVTAAHHANDGYFGVNDTIDLSHFEALEHLSWTGFGHLDDYVRLEEIFDQCSQQLVSLHLDGLDVFRNDPFKNGQDTLPTFLPDSRPVQLKRLSLGGLHLEGPEKIIESLNFFQLQSLKIRSCFGWGHFLQTLSRQPKAVNLKKFAITALPSADIWEDHPENYTARIIADFLESFTGLEELAVSLEGWPRMAALISKAALHHSKSLRRMVFHLASTNGAGEELIGEKNPDMLRTFAWPALQTRIDRWDLECLGVSCTPKYLPILLRPLCQKNTLKILHVRQSGQDIERDGSVCLRRPVPVGSYQSNDILNLTTPAFHDLVYWAFGPSGIASLQTIAFGDFSCRGRFTSHNLILNRAGAPAIVGQTLIDGELSCLVLDPRLECCGLSDVVCEFLEACPREPLLKIDSHLSSEQSRSSPFAMSSSSSSEMLG
ncbi:hypothetical protein F5Y16DRAFT_421045 [Xylariaceae sp. FL0255]|nr:hypothetical protein F5Y16DRAFT_421045 [Xylariaceae sp. FL0255]